MVEKWLRDVKWGQMLGWAAGAATGAHEYLGRMGVSDPAATHASGVVAVAAMLLYFLNPKGRDWVPPGAVVVDRFAAPEEPRFAVELPVAPPPADIPAWKTGGGGSVGALTPEEEAVVLALRAGKGGR
jgi:hypothetical protein